jgi:Fur family ferric uptake transcriptional regulator
MGESQSFTQQFHDRGFRLTPQRLVILQVLSDSNEHLTPSQVYERVRKMMPGVTEATIYRTLEFLARNDLAFAAHVGNGSLPCLWAGEKDRPCHVVQAL